MRRTFLRLALILLLTGAGTIARAQFPYTFTTFTDTYVPLTGATSINNNAIWRDTSDFTFPVGFNYTMNGITGNTVFLKDVEFLTPTNAAIQSGFVISNGILQDRRVSGGATPSVIRYKTSGNAGARIFKLEVFNAGFATEHDLYSTQLDSMSYQVWIYEQNSAVEVRFGPSRISHFSDYFDNGLTSTLYTGYISGLQEEDFKFNKFYLLNGNAATPAVDSITNPFSTKGLSNMPASGRVYRYAPRPGSTSVGNMPGNSVGRIYPNPASDRLFIESTDVNAFQIVSMTGSVQAQGTVNSRKQEVDISSLAPGMYLLKLTNNRQQTGITRFVKQ